MKKIDKRSAQGRSQQLAKKREYIILLCNNIHYNWTKKQDQ